MPNWLIVAIIVLGAYFVGNISFARIISRKKNQDVTKLGSGNPGSTNMLRNFGFKIGFLTFICDVLKGVLPALVVRIVLPESPVLLYLAGLCTIIGHIYPILYKFKGGKGIATMVGFFLVANPIFSFGVVLVAMVSWLIFKYGSMASFICVTAMTVVQGVWAKSTLELNESKWVCLILYCIFLLTWWAHRQNIQRLLIGKESKVSLIKSTKKKVKEQSR